MDLEKLYKLQSKLDSHILENNNIEMSENELLDNTILALLVEVGELANTTRCFKHWSKKGMMEKEVVLDELADVWHFYLSIGNQLSLIYTSSLEEFNTTKTIVNSLTSLYIVWICRLGNTSPHNMSKDTKYEYLMVGFGINLLAEQLGFTNEEVEQAYLKKHKENYKRQEEGY